MNRTPLPTLRKRIRLSFEVDVEYRPIPLNGQDAELGRLRQLLLDRPDLMDRLLGNQALRALAEFLEGQLRPNGLFGYEEEDLLEAAARRASPADVLPLLAAIASDWGFEYMEPVTRAPVTSQVASVEAVDLDNGAPVTLRPPAEPLVRRRARHYLIAETETALVVNATAYYTTADGWLFDARQTVEGFLADAQALRRPVALIEFTIYAASPQEYEQVKAALEALCRELAPQARLSYGWFTTFRVEVPALGITPI